MQEIQRCEICDEPTGRCDEDALRILKTNGSRIAVCEECFDAETQEKNMIPVAEQPKPPSTSDGFMSALDFLKAEKERSCALGATMADLYRDSEEWKSKSDEEKQLCYMDFAERYADYVCGFEKRYSR